MHRNTKFFLYSLYVKCTISTFFFKLPPILSAIISILEYEQNLKVQ
jgi:hypothetical protein